MALLTDRVAVVTGAATGIGRSVARRYAAEGASVVLVDLDAQGLEASVAEILADGNKAQAVVGDVSDEALVTEVAALAAATGTLGVWVNNAGVTRPAMLHKMAVDDFDLVLRVHVRGTFLGLRAAAQYMREHEVRGSIVNVTSSAGLNGTIGQVNYSAAKGAVVAMTKSGARELGRSGIRVNAVSPNAATTMTETIRTDERFAATYLEKIPLGRWAEPDEIAEAFLFLASDASSYVTGQVLCADGGSYMAS